MGDQQRLPTGDGATELDGLTELDGHIVGWWDFGDPAGSARVFAAAARRAESTGQALIITTQQARAVALAGDPAAAGALLDQVARGLADLPRSDGARRWVEAYLRIERGRVRNSGGDPGGSIGDFAAAYDLATEAGAAGLAIDALHMTAIAVGATDSPEAAAEWNLRALAEADASTDPRARRWLGSLLNNLGWDRHAAGRYSDALEIFERALAIRTEGSDGEAIAVARWSVARALRSLGRYDEALAIQQALNDDPANADDGFVGEEVAELLVALGRPAEARIHAARALDLLGADGWFAEHEPSRLTRLRELAN